MNISSQTGPYRNDPIPTARDGSLLGLDNLNVQQIRNLTERSNAYDVKTELKPKMRRGLLQEAETVWKIPEGPRKHDLNSSQ